MQKHSPICLYQVAQATADRLKHTQKTLACFLAGSPQAKVKASFSRGNAWK